ncbi:hypothetical protein [Fuscibacter oryzae]|uniref:Lipoprotein n=1 Tax=Fuscibacter oryzae TaxID=2803939 RepID=A0A8J7MR49_9RHOB|nr:hypothetical protein [Fuscibacter oryzae]MBL4928668.1 hypothetical protein [Fuscibacter oryzae]
MFTRFGTFASVAALSGLAVTAGWAKCPQAMDDEGGIVLTRSAPLLSSHFRKMAGGLSEDRTTQKGSETEEVHWTYRHALAPSEKKSASGGYSFEYDTATNGLDDLPKLKVWQSDVQIISGGQPFASGHVTKTFLGTETVKLGKCRYEAWAVDDRLVLPNDDSTYRQFYVPQLGIVVASFLLGPDGDVVSGVQYDKIAVGDK